MNHLTVLVAWHDSGWNGRICKNPKENKYCESFRWIRRVKFGYYLRRGYIEKLRCDLNARKEANKVIYSNMKWGVCHEINIFHTNKVGAGLYGWEKTKKIANNKVSYPKEV